MSTIEKKAVEAGKFVNAAHVDNLIRTYKKERWLQNSERLGKDDTLDIWYSLEGLEEFIQMAKLNGSNGVRVCFGVYDENNAPKAGMEGKQTVAFVATRCEEGGEVPVLKDLYMEKNGKASLVAFNTSQGWPWGPAATDGDSLGALIVTNKDKGLMVI